MKLKMDLMEWNYTYFGNIFQKKRVLLARLVGVQKLLAVRQSQWRIRLEMDIRHELDEVLKQEEMFWFQRSREEWIRFGDLNTKFYHASIVVKRSRNTIQAL
ncbi:hypothetical protein PTKIN_Ptkin03bG0075000 [Pterospermum kingtungense]